MYPIMFSNAKGQQEWVLYLSQVTALCHHAMGGWGVSDFELRKDRLCWEDAKSSHRDFPPVLIGGVAQVALNLFRQTAAWHFCWQESYHLILSSN